MPLPARRILVAGALALVVGAGALGYALSREAEQIPASWRISSCRDAVSTPRFARPIAIKCLQRGVTGVAAGVWDDLEAVPEIPDDLVAEPALALSERAAERERWAEACALVTAWRR